MSVVVTLDHGDHHVLLALDLFNKVGDGVWGDGARRLCWVLGKIFKLPLYRAVILEMR